MLDAARLTRAAAVAALLMSAAACKPGAAARGKQVIGRSACGSCHAIPGIPLADGMVGPSLAGVAGRTLIAGVLPNTPSNLASWMHDPQRFAPGGAMPPTPLSPGDARDAAAYLDTLRGTP